MTSLIGPRQGRSRSRVRVGVIAAASLALFALGACSSSGGSSAPSTSGGSAPAAGLAADEWVTNAGDYKEAANWDTAQTVSLDLGASAMTPGSLELVAGEPYVIEITNNGAAAQGVSAPDWFRSVAVRKTESGAEIKLHQFTDVYANAGKTVSLYLVPVFPGTYPLEGVAGGIPVEGLSGQVTVTGSVPTAPAPVVEKLSSVGVPAGAADMIAKAIPTWDAKAKAVTITMDDQNGKDGTGIYKPKNAVLKVGVPVTLTFTNKGSVMHVYECEDFLKTAALWKVAAADGYNTGVMARPADVEAGVTTSLFLIPTVAGTYTLTDSAPGMEKMSATITVTK
ncbi:MAG: hypothetical protein U0990_00910 [Candidatus Nanopelagicales bacterium]|nr:hypothetical protein [Candidatus Nanopelagicales bacterium]MDZ4248636.1 hypothetical protein [Candidatus Nanopelagicales bacterium]